MHVGLIGGIGPAATDLYYRGLIDRWEADESLDPGALTLTIAHASAKVLVKNFTDGRPDRQAEIFAGLVQRLKEAGAEAAAVTSMGGHFCIGELEQISPLPTINAIPVIDRALGARGWSRVGTLGTFRVMQTGFYGGVSSVEVIAPPEDQIDLIHQTYLEIAFATRCTDDQRRVMVDAGREMIETQGADAVILGGTDLFLAFEDVDPGYPVIDSADLHMDAIDAVAKAPSGTLDDVMGSVA